MRRLFALALLTLLPVAAFAQKVDAKRFAPITERFETFVKDRDAAGAVLLVGRADGVKYHAAIGRRDVDANAAMEPDTLFRIASMTKPVTAIAVMILQDEGKLSVDDPVEKHLPEFKGQMMVVAADKEKGTVTLGKPPRPIRLRDLLTHTSGLPTSYPAGFADVYLKRNRTLAETTVAISQQPLVSEPGAKWAYCNPGIDTLGRVVEVVSGESFEQFVQARILDPLGMKDTTFYPTAAQAKRVAVTYGKSDGKLTAAKDTLLAVEKGAKHPVPAGGLYSTAADLAQLYRMMLNKGALGGKRVLSEAAVEQMTKTQTGDIKTGFVDGMSWGFGWQVVKEPKGVTGLLSAGTYGHGGAFATQGWIDPKEGAFYVLLIQRTGLPNGDDSEMRKEFQRLAVEALKR